MDLRVFAAGWGGKAEEEGVCPSHIKQQDMQFLSPKEVVALCLPGNCSVWLGGERVPGKCGAGGREINVGGMVRGETAGRSP